MSEKPLLVTRHAALAAYMREIGLIGEDAEICPHAGAEEVRGRHVVGVLPMHLAALAASYTTVTLDIPYRLRGVELDLEQVRECAGDAVTYVVRVVKQA